MCNISPQDPHMNRTIWSRLEDWMIRNTIISHHTGDDCQVHVITGPLWMPSRQLDSATGKFEYNFLGIGQPPSLVSVPSHFFKVVVVLKDKRIIKFACFVIANRGHDEDTKMVSLQDYLVRWTALEAVQFFPNLVNDHWRETADQLTTDQQQHNTLLSAPRLMLQQDNSSLAKRRRMFGEKSVKHLCTGGSCRLV